MTQRSLVLRTTFAILVLLASTSDGKLTGRSRKDHPDAPFENETDTQPQQQQQQQQRQLVFVEETHPCVDFEAGWIQNARFKRDNPWGLYSQECDTNECNTGCCRAYTNVLTCDDVNDYPHMPCICNENTATAAPKVDPTATPTTAPTTSAPTAGPTATPTSAPTAGPTGSDRSSTGPPGGGIPGIPGGSTNNPGCLEYFQSCNGDGQCCSGRCHLGSCRSTPHAVGGSRTKISNDPDRTEGTRGGAAGRGGGGEVGFGFRGRVRG